MVRDGYIYGLSLLAVAVLLVWATGAWAWGIVPVLLAAFFLWFFRDPRRAIPTGAGLIVSPGDGKVSKGLRRLSAALLFGLLGTSGASAQTASLLPNMHLSVQDNMVPDIDWVKAT